MFLFGQLSNQCGLFGYRQIVLLQQWQRISSQEQHARPCLQEFVNYTYEKAQEFADSVDKKLHRGVFARSDAFNFGFKH